MVRLQTQLTEDQVKALKEMAAEEGVSVAELLRRGADLVLRQRRSAQHIYLKRLKLLIVGFDSGVSDLATNHDTYLEEAFDGR